MPDRNATSIQFTAQKRRRTKGGVEEAYQQAVRQRWRALVLTVKAKLQAVESGIVTFEEEFAMHIVLPGGGTVAEQVIPAIAQAYETGSVPPMITA